MTDRDIRAIVALVGTPGWDALVKRAGQRIDTAQFAWRNRSDPKLSDEYLRGLIEGLEWLTSLPDKLEQSSARLSDEERSARRYRESADLIARVGATFPGAGEGPWR